MTFKTFFCNTALSFIFLLISQTGFTQENYYTVWYSSDSNHLPQNSVKSIVQDKHGFIWLSTENGLVRYDGQNFKTYNTGNVKNVGSNRMRLFSGDKQRDSIIIINEKSEFLLIQNHSVKRIYTVVPLNDSLTNISESSYILYPASRYAINKNKYIFSSQHKIFRLANGHITQYDSSFKPKKQINCIYKDSSQFFAAAGNLYSLCDKSNYTLYTAPEPRCYKFDRTFNCKTRIYSNTFAEQNFICAGNELYLIKPVDGRLTTQLVFDDFDCEANNIVSVYYDTQNEILFLGSTNKGLLVVKKKDFHHNATEYHHASGTDDVYYALTQYKRSSILTSTGEIFNKNGETSLIDIGAYTDKYTLVIDNNGDVWTKEHAMLYRFKKNSAFKSFDKWELKNPISTITKGNNGSIYIGVFHDKNKKGGFLYSINPNAANSGPKLALSMSFTPSELKNTEGSIFWAGSWKGLYKIDVSNGKTTKIKGLGSPHVRNIYPAKPNEIWVGTYNKGFYLVRNGKVTKLPLDKKGYLLSAHCIVEDKHGFFWITTNKGLFQVKKQDLYDYADNKLKNVYYHIYEKNAGFINNEFNGGCSPCGIYLNQESIFFPSMDGIVYYNPSSIKTRLPSSNIYLDEINIDGKKQTVNDTLVLNRKFGRLQFFFTSPFFGNPYNQNIDTKLEGPVVQDWTPVNEDNVSFSTLPPGDYILKARKLNGFGSKYIYTNINFSIMPAFWQTRWFTLILIVLIVLLAYLVFKLRLRYIKHKNVQLEKQVILKTQQLQDTIAALRKTKDELSTQVTNHKSLIKTITHDIKSPLSFMAITGRFLYNAVEKTQPEIREDIKAMYTSSQQLYNFVDKFLEYAKETDLNSNESLPYSLHILVQEKISFFKNIASAGKNVLVNNIDPNLTITANRHLLSIILHNLLDNAIKNTLDGKISLTASVNDKVVSITVKDTGNGMDPEKAKYYEDLIKEPSHASKQSGIGLHIIIDLLVIMEGTINIRPEKNQGTAITISFIQPDQAV